MDLEVFLEFSDEVGGVGAPQEFVVKYFLIAVAATRSYTAARQLHFLAWFCTRYTYKYTYKVPSDSPILPKTFYF